VTLQPTQRVTHIIVGTKAQFIKMAPICRLLEHNGWPYRILDLGQHGSITPGIMRDFELNPDLVYVLPGGSTVATYSQAIHWVSALAARIRSSKRKLTGELLKQPAGYALIHGDTLSTLLGMHLAKRLGLPVGLVEAGLSSGRLFDPFPEEIIRRHVEKRADVLFAPDQKSAERLQGRGLTGVIVNTGYNTGRDALLTIAEMYADVPNQSQDFSTVFTLHRAETLSNRSRLRAVIEHVMQLAPIIGPIRFYLHEPTQRALVSAKLMDKLEASSCFELHPLASYPEFTAALMRAKYILTDGGSVQEEASYLNKPCLILRRRTERSHGLGTTAMLTSMNVASDLDFLRKDPAVPLDAAAQMPTLEASKRIIDTLTANQPEVFQPRIPNDADDRHVP
jgi:UDP-N-acetylglucosamine 2-epimerase (non-hydrolysing)